MRTGSDEMGCTSLFLAGLALLFIAFKLAEIIDWSWWWVLIPLYIKITLVATSILIQAVKETVKEMKE